VIRIGDNSTYVEKCSYLWLLPMGISAMEIDTDDSIEPFPAAPLKACLAWQGVLPERMADRDITTTLVLIF
jgi:hypothetical protein